MIAFATHATARVIRLPPRAARPGFTRRDLAELEGWARGERSFTLEEGEAGPFAMLYPRAMPWAAWGVARQDSGGADGSVLVWDCVTLADLGRFACMQEALAAMPGAAADDGRCAPSNVHWLQLAGARPG